GRSAYTAWLARSPLHADLREGHLLQSRSRGSCGTLSFAEVQHGVSELPDAGSGRQQVLQSVRRGASPAMFVVWARQRAGREVLLGMRRQADRRDRHASFAVLGARGSTRALLGNALGRATA